MAIREYFCETCNNTVEAAQPINEPVIDEITCDACDGTRQRVLSKNIYMHWRDGHHPSGD